MNLSDSDLLMLQNLTYISEDTAKLVKGLRDIRYYHTLKDYLDVFDETALLTLEAGGDTIVNHDNSSGSELAAMLRYMKSSKSIGELSLTDFLVNKNNHVIALCFFNHSEPAHGIVVFFGTIDEDEWKDNALGLYQADTEAQKEALTFIEKLPYDTLTVVGHSKGGNKAQYVTILSPKVQKGVSFNGQGFSEEFLQKYSNEIQKNAYKITNYNLSTDYVHPLLFTLPGVTTYYVRGGADVKNLIQHHSANSFFEYYKDSNRYTQVVCTKDGNAYFPFTEESALVRGIHNYTDFLQNNATESDKRLLGNYIGDLLYIETKDTDDEESQRKKLIQRLFQNPEEFATLLAYTIRFIEVYHLDNKELVLLLYAIGLARLQSIIKLNPAELETLYKTLRIENDVSEKYKLLYQLFQLLERVVGVGINILSLWQEFEDKYRLLEDMI